MEQNSQIFTRIYSDTSAGQLTSGRERHNLPLPLPLSEDSLRSEFDRHMRSGNRNHTALVSISTRLVDTCHRAFRRYYEDGEDVNNIWIAFLKIPVDTTGGFTPRTYWAKPLAEACGHEEPHRFYYEYVVEWAIPETCVIHKVSLATLMNRGLAPTEKGVTLGRASPDACEPRTSAAADLSPKRSYLYDPYEEGMFIGFITQTFGARSPLNWVAERLSWECKNLNFPWMSLASRQEHRVGVDFALIDLWLQGSQFCEEYDAFQSWRDLMMDVIIDRYERFVEAWHGYDETPENLDIYEEALQVVLVNDVEKDIEDEMVRIGL